MLTHDPDLWLQMAALFASIDTDGSGTVSRQELKAKLESDDELQSLVTAAGGDGSSRVFEQLDQDGDGVITLKELRNMATLAVSASEIVTMCLAGAELAVSAKEIASVCLAGASDGVELAATAVQAGVRGRLARARSEKRRMASLAPRRLRVDPFPRCAPVPERWAYKRSAAAGPYVKRDPGIAECLPMCDW